MKDILSSIFETNKERLKNPIIGSFLTSWILINWKPILILIFSSKNIEDKIKFITLEYNNIFNILILPLLFSFLYIIVFPYLLMFIDKLTKKATEGRKNEALNLTILDVKNKQKLAEEESELENIKASFREKKDLNKKIEILTTQLDERENLIDILNKEIENLTNISTNKNESLEQNDLLENEYRKFKETYEFVYFKDIGKEISSRRYLPDNIDILVVEKFKILDIILETRDDENQRSYFDFTEKGKYFWKRYLLGMSIKKKVYDEDDDLPF
ncbi:hypothetical protein [Chryseobacterium oryctis]|uniref:Uncharacterized protein n=1 Tax=Chryseobacterium oryctis TaxID=2952618 RepID=A0ABT3HN18_9FLAO|nr:hypothetical protein [Chryseobacterium oryctis]MCW3161144.1 hypothetical protein [Chryseobacterium oryctis]